MTRRDRWRRWLAGGALVLAGGCSSMSNTEKGLGVGALGGAGVGALVGSASGNAGKGALIGSAVGAIGGALVGNDADKQEKLQLQAQAAEAQQVRGSLSLPDIVSMSQQHISDAVIINQIRSSGTVYNLNAQEVQYLQSSGVSEAVVMEMQNTRNRVAVVPQRVIMGPPPPVVQPVYVVQPAPPPPPVGFGFSYSTRIH
jgi:hypothetical protein